LSLDVVAADPCGWMKRAMIRGSPVTPSSHWCA
jgi:hypothetical protein